jgi:hypothetical protein
MAPMSMEGDYPLIDPDPVSLAQARRRVADESRDTGLHALVRLAAGKAENIPSTRRVAKQDDSCSMPAG